jgi:hypothetical protein
MTVWQRRASSVGSTSCSPSIHDGLWPKAKAALALVLGVGGCGQNWFASRATNPVVQENIGPRASRGPLTTVSTTAAHRTAYMRLGGGQPGAEGVPGASPTQWVGKAGQICPEPPPDVAQAVAEQLSAALSVQGTGAALERSLATSVAPLIRRSQGLQYHRDQVFYLCVAYMNDLLDKDTFLQEWQAAQERSAKIIEAEVRETEVSTVTLPDGVTMTVPPSALPGTLAALASGSQKPATAAEQSESESKQ